MVRHGLKVGVKARDCALMRFPSRILNPWRVVEILP